MIDIVREIQAVQREVGEGTIPAGAGRSVRLQREYNAPIDDVWDALTNPERIGRWFLPISGDFRLGGRYQFEGNAGGRIVACEQPHRLYVTWEYGPAAHDPDADSHFGPDVPSAWCRRLDDGRLLGWRWGGSLDHPTA